MLLDEKIHKHVDEMDLIEEKINKEIDRVYNAIDIDLLIDNPSEFLLGLAAELEDVILDDFAPEAINLGIKFAQEVKKAREDIVIADTNNPNLNKELQNV